MNQPKNLIPTEHDRVVLGSRDQYATYFKVAKRALSCLMRNNDQMLQDDVFSSLELEYLQQYSHLLLNSLAAYRLRYMHDADNKLKIDTTYSGWPNYTEFRFLVNDLELKESKLNQLPSEQEVKEYMLQHLLRDRKPVPDKLFHQAALVKYYSTINALRLFRRFNQGKVILDEGRYVVSWAFYDVSQNRPYVMFMEFGYTGNDIGKDSSDLQSLYKSLRTYGYRIQPLHVMASQIDRENSNIYPKRLKCIDLGTLFSVFTRDDHPVSQTILHGIKDRQLLIDTFALLLRIDVLESTGQKELSGGGIFSTSKLVQQFAVKNKSYGSTFHHEYLFGPHRAIQLITEKQPELARTLTRTITEK